MIEALVLVDLDDTLFQTLRKQPSSVGVSALAPMAYDRAGQPLGFATPAQASFLDWISRTGRIIPVTARSREAFGRVRIACAEAICAHGGVILDETGGVDAPWRERMAAAARCVTGELAALAALAEQCTRAMQTPVSVRLLSEGETPLYLLLKHPSADQQALDVVADAVAAMTPAGWTVHRNGNNAAFLPPYLGKHFAVERLLADLRPRFPGAVTVGVGDSLTDAAFMRICDFAMTPAASQLGRRLLGEAA